MGLNVNGWPKAILCFSTEVSECKTRVERPNSLQAKPGKGKKGHAGLSPGVIGLSPAPGPTIKIKRPQCIFVIQQGETNRQDKWVGGPTKSSKN